MSTRETLQAHAAANVAGRLKSSDYHTPAGEAVLLRDCRGLDEFDACVDLQQQTWGLSERELAPRKTFLLAQELGGQVIGAFDPSGKLVACVVALAAIAREAGDAAQVYLHSHMLAVRPEYRNSGIGTRLKLAQREDALARGIEFMTWTFDPTQGRNANLNLHRLGAVARRYSPDFYGVSSSRLQAGLPSDRLHAEWWMRSPRVCTQVTQLLETGRNGQSMTIAGRHPRSASGPERTILIPAAIDEWKKTPDGLARAHALQQKNRELFEQAFADGLAATGFHWNAAGDGVYELSPWSPPSASKPSTTLEEAYEN